MDRSELLTANFYSWEILGRGWLLWEEVIDLEPSFVPFFGHVPIGMPTPQKGNDDGRRYSILGFIGKEISNLFAKNTSASQKEVVPQDYLTKPYAFPDYGQMIELSVHLPRTWNGNFEAMTQLVDTLTTVNIPTSFEIIGTGKEIHLHFTTYASQAKWLYDQLRILFPHITVHEAHPHMHQYFNPDLPVYCTDYGLAQEFMRPLSTSKGGIESSMNIVTALEGLVDGEMGVYQIIMQGAINPWIPSILKSVSDGSGGSFFADAPEMLSLARDKTSNPLCAVSIRSMVQGLNENRTLLLGSTMERAVVSGTKGQFNNLIPLDDASYPVHFHAVDIIKRQSRRYGMILNTREVSSLLQFPTARRGKLATSGRTSVPVPHALLGHGMVIGTNPHLGKDTNVTLSIPQRLRHTHLIGATGVGKSTLLINMMIQDIEQGRGLTLLDPHGDVADTILSYVPKERIQDVILVDPSDSEYPVGFNILSAKTEAEKIVLSADLVGIFKRLSSSWGDQMDAILGNAINTFLEHPDGGTLLDLKMFLVEPVFRKKFLKGVKDGYIRNFWEKEYMMMRKNSASPLLTRLDIFLRPKIIRGMMTQKEGLDFSDVIRSNKIVIVKLAQGLIGEANSYLLGTLITSKLYQAAQGRQGMDKEKRNPYFIYIDEFQNFITPSMEAILSGARKFGLGLVLAHQDLQQLFKTDMRVANSIISNAGTRICFRVGENDAQKLEKGFSHFEARDLQNLDVGEAIIRAGRSDNDCNIATSLLPEIPIDAETNTQSIIQNTRTNYAGTIVSFEGTHTKEDEIIEDIPYEEVVETDVVPPKNEKVDTREEPKDTSLPPIKNTERTDEFVEDFKQKERERNRVREHLRIQNFIKKTAGEYNFKADIEAPTQNPKGRIDVAILTEKLRIAVEVSVTTPPDYELGNMRKCLQNGYDIIFMISDDDKHLGNIKKLATAELQKSELDFIIFGSTKDLIQSLHEISLQEKPKEKKVKGYRIKVNYKKVSDEENRRKESTIIKAIVDSIRKKKS